MPELITFKDPYGKSRKGYKKICIQCGNDFFTRVSQDYACCSLVCANQYKRLTSEAFTDLECYVCHEVFSRRKTLLNRSRSGLYFCSRKCKEFAQSLEGGVKEIQPSHYGTAGIDYRSLFAEEELICARCGYDEFKSCVDIHHIDHDRENNDKSNLIPLCSNCHQGIHRGCWKIDELRAIV
jgi:hypothetical protein